MASAPVPRDRGDFHIVIVCALEQEAECVYDALDTIWDSKNYGKASSDDNTYTLGAIGEHNVVLNYISGIGTDRAALARSNLTISFPNIKLALVVGVCGGMPYDLQNEEIVLGDVIISEALVRYDFGKQYPQGFERKSGIHDLLGPSTEKILGLLKRLKTKQARAILQENVMAFLRAIQQKSPEIVHPGTASDILYHSSYAHQHRAQRQCSVCGKSDKVCDDATTTNCEDLGCDAAMRVTRSRLIGSSSSTSVKIHFGTMALVNTVMKSGHHRDALAKEGIIAVEMEGVGAWRYGATIVIKGVCDYADSHKRNDWQQYAAATAAAGAKAFLLELTPGNPQDSSHILFKTHAFSATSMKPVWHVPFDPKPGFVGREDEFRLLEQQLFAPDSARTAALFGLGGVGKSRLALEFALRIRSRSPTYMILWVQASEQSTFDNDMLEIGIKLGILGIEDKKQDVKALVKRWLSNTERQWLLILDNADDILLWGKGTTPGSTQTSLVEYLPRTATGSILVTTRSGHVAKYIAETEVIELLPPSADQAREMFTKRLQKPDLAADQDALFTLLDQLAYLPLALVQAASFMNRTQRPIGTYLDQIRKSEEHILQLLSQDFGDRSRYQNAINPVATTWLITFRHIRAHSPFAATLLSRIACFYERCIPQSLLRDDDSELDDFDFIDAITVLIEYSLVTVTSSSSPGTDETYNIHRLVQLAARNWLKLEGTQSTHIKASILRLAQLFPVPNFEHKSIWTIYLPHALRVCEEDGGEDLPERYDLLEKVALCFMIEGRYDEAVEALTKAVKWREQLGVSNQCMYDAYNHLGEALRFRGEWSRAEACLRQAYTWRKESLGKEHPSTLTSMDNLAEVLRDQGKYDKAEEMHRQAVEVRERVLGKEHPSTLTSIDNLALVLSRQGKYSEAEEIHSQVVEVTERVLGKEHPSTLTSMDNFAGVLKDQGKYDKAEVMHRQVMRVTERVLGKEHPSTLTSMDNLAGVLKDQGKHDEAEVMHRQVMRVRERVLGKEHPATLTSMDNLAGVLKDQGKHDEAEVMHRQVMRVRERVLGKEHPATLTSMNNLATSFRDRGKPDEAQQMYEHVLRTSEKLLGNNHPSTLTTITYLGRLYADQGRLMDAERTYLRALPGQSKAPGLAHILTLEIIDSLGTLYRAQEKLLQAEEIYSLVLDVFESGYKSTLTLSIMRKLGNVYIEQGRTNDFEKINAQVQAFQVSEYPVSSNIDIENSDEESEMSDVPSLLSDSTEVSMNEGYEFVIEHMVELLHGDEKTNALYRGISDHVNSKKFIQAHDQILKLYFQDLRDEVKHANELKAIRSLRNPPQRKKITSLILKFLEYNGGENETQATLTFGASIGRTEERKKTLNAILLNLSNPDTSIYNDNVSDSSDSDSEPEEGDNEMPPEESMSPLRAVESFLTGGKAFARLQVNLTSLLHQPRNIEEAMLSDSIFVLKWFLKKNLGDVEGKWKDRILQLRSKGHSNTEIAKVLLEPQKPVEVNVETNIKYDIEVNRHGTMLLSGVSSVLERLRWFFSEYLRSVGNAMILCESLRHLGYLVESCSTIRPFEELRLKWTCKCGQRRFFDLSSNDIAAAHQLGARLTQHPHQSVIANPGVTVSSPTATSGQSATSATQPGGSSSINTIGGSGTTTIQPGGASTTNSATGGISYAFSNPRFLLVCINEANLTTALAQIPCQRYCSDQSLFASVRRKYEEKSSHPLRWYSIMIPYRVELVRFVIVPRKSSTKSHQRVEVLRPIPSIPPEEEVTVYQRYHYEPCTLKANDIPMGDFLHAFFVPGDHTKDYWVQSLPKKLLQELQYDDSQTQAIGWGIHIEEKLNMLLVTLLLIASLVSTTLFCILWTIMKHGAIQDSYTMGSYILTLEGLVFGFLYFFWQRPQIYQY